MLQKTKGLVIGLIKHSETSIICKIYTEKLGLQSYMVKGVRTSKSKSRANILQPLNILELEVYHRDAKNLQMLKEFRLSHFYKNIPADMVKTCLGFFLLEIIQQSLKEEQGDITLFEFIENQFINLDDHEGSLKDFHLYFLFAFAKQLGFFPHGNFSERENIFDLQNGNFTNEIPGHPYFIRHGEARIFNAYLQNETTADASFSERRKVLDNLISYYRLHVPGFREPKSVKVLEEILRA
jgi:DNA repair protein RecO (recombination protein O)